MDAVYRMLRVYDHIILGQYASTSISFCAVCSLGLHQEGSADFSKIYPVHASEFVYGGDVRGICKGIFCVSHLLKERGGDYADIECRRNWFVIFTGVFGLLRGWLRLFSAISACTNRNPHKRHEEGAADLPAIGTAIDS